MTQPKQKEKIVIKKVARRKKTAKPKAQKAVVPYKKTQNRFSVGWDSGRLSNYGFAVHTEDAYDPRHRLSKNQGHDVHSRGENPIVKAWRSSQKANQYGQLMPKKDTMEPFDAVVGLVNGTVTYSVASYQINPGNALMFPLLSQTAKLYERYNFMSLEFYVTPIVTPYTGDGKIIMSCDLEGIEEGNPTSAAMQENNTIHSDGMPYEAFGFQVAGVVRHEDSWFVRTTQAFPAGADPRKYDCGTLYIGTYGNNGHNGSAMCELRVRGVCALFDKLQESQGAALPISTYQLGTCQTGPPFGPTITSGAATALEFETSLGANNVSGSPWTVSAPGTYMCPLTSYYRVRAQFNLSAANDFLSSLWILAVDNVNICNLIRLGAKSQDDYHIECVMLINQGATLRVLLTASTLGAVPISLIGGILTIETV